MKKFKKYLLEEDSLNSGEQEIPEYQKSNPNYNKPGTVLNLPFETAAAIKLLDHLSFMGPHDSVDTTSIRDSSVHSKEFNKNSDSDKRLEPKPVFSDAATDFDAYWLPSFFNIGVYGQKYAEEKRKIHPHYYVYSEERRRHVQNEANKKLQEHHDLVTFLGHPGHTPESLHNHFLDMMHLASRNTSPVLKNQAYHTVLEFTLKNPNRSAVEPLIDKLMRLAEPKFKENKESTTSEKEHSIEPIKTDDLHRDALYAPEDKKTYDTLFGGISFMGNDGVFSVDHFFSHLIRSPHISGKQVKEIEDFTINPKNKKRSSRSREDIISILQNKTWAHRGGDIHADSDTIKELASRIDIDSHEQKHPWTNSPEYKNIWISREQYENKGGRIFIKTRPIVTYNRTNVMSKIGIPAINENYIKSVLFNLLKENNEQEDYEKNRSEMLDSIHSMPLEDAKTHGELDLITEPSVFSANYNTVGSPYILLKQNHAFTKYLTHPKHTDESVLEDLNFLMNLAHKKDYESGPEYVNVRGRRHQADVYSFTLNNFPTIAYAMGKTLFDNEPRFITSELNREHPPVQVAPELLQNIKKQHGTIRTKAPWHYHGAFLNDRGEDMWWQKNFSPLDVYNHLTRRG